MDCGEKIHDLFCIGWEGDFCFRIDNRFHQAKSISACELDVSDVLITMLYVFINAFYDHFLFPIVFYKEKDEISPV